MGVKLRLPMPKQVPAVLRLGVVLQPGVAPHHGEAKVQVTLRLGVVPPLGVVKVLAPLRHGVATQPGVTNPVGAVLPHGRQEASPMAHLPLGVDVVTSLLMAVRLLGVVTTIMLVAHPLGVTTGISRQVATPHGLTKRMVTSPLGVIKVTDQTTEAAAPGEPTNRSHVNTSFNNFLLLHYICSYICI